ncbi:ankyrin repeat domain protein [Striga asiatica]|uniref:Ankyrin repeat domain protein n=1 Tax=Striga asiatica TaxID=4170 RepID=A0A5A7PRR8_STRAF|nr:ankyrin repeat domain protein [Striga asiatica]
MKAAIRFCEESIPNGALEGGARRTTAEVKDGDGMVVSAAEGRVGVVRVVVVSRREHIISNLGGLPFSDGTPTPSFPPVRRRIPKIARGDLMVGFEKRRLDGREAFCKERRRWRATATLSAELIAIGGNHIIAECGEEIVADVGPEFRAENHLPNSISFAMVREYVNRVCTCYSYFHYEVVN